MSVDALLIELSNKPIDHAEEEGQSIIHFAKDGEPVLLEIPDAKEFEIGTDSLWNSKHIISILLDN